VTLEAIRTAEQHAAPASAEREPSWLVRRLGPAWPLKILLVGIPLWWALGLASFAFLIAAVIMAAQMRRRGVIRLPAGFGVWVLFLLWMLAGVAVLWAQAPGTIDGGGPERLVGFLYRVAWYLAITVAMLYPLSLSSRDMPAVAVARWLGALFLTCIVGGLFGLLLPNLEFTSLAELVIPGAKSGFLQEKFHPALTTSSGFLGYEQPRPEAPFTYANAWGNNVGLLLPFFLFGWLTSTREWQRVVAPGVAALALVPIAFSLNRGLWLGLVFLAAYAAFVFVRGGQLAVLWGMVTALGVAVVVLMASPLGDTIALRLDTPHSNDRRGTVAEVVIATTWEGSPVLGFGTTRQVAGNFDSLAGGATPQCKQCAAPPLGTQGFLWRLIFTTGFVGTALFLAFIAVQWLTHFRRRDPVSVLGCMSLAVSCLFMFVYDSLESPLFILMIAVGLMNRARLESPLTRSSNLAVSKA